MPGRVVSVGQEKTKAVSNAQHLRNAPVPTVARCGSVAGANVRSDTQSKKAVDPMVAISGEKTAYTRFEHFWKSFWVTTVQRGAVTPVILAQPLNVPPFSAVTRPRVNTPSREPAPENRPSPTVSRNGHSEGATMRRRS